MDEERDNEAFIERVASVLRAPEVVGPDFERRVMASVREVSRDRRSAWRAPRTFTISPLRILALAAGFAGLVVLGTTGVQRLLGAPSEIETVARGAADTVHVVRFVLQAPQAGTVALVGDFNAWERDATLLTPVDEGGVWSVSLPLAPGRHEYAFVVDGERWIADPLAMRHVDEFGTESSILRVGAEVRPGA